MKHLFLITISFLFFNAFAENIIGTWNNDETGKLVFNANGNGKLGDADFTFTYTTNKIVATSADGQNFYYSYKLANGQLTISGGIFDSPVTFTKGSSSGTLGNTGVTQGGIDKSIVGTWCWTNASGVNTNATSSNTRCIVINGDGTYQYTYEGSISGNGGGYYGGSSSQSSDHGTWTINGNTVNIISASQGAQTLSFQKKNHPKTGDPMIIIGGDAYVTYYQKAPW